MGVCDGSEEPTAHDRAVKLLLQTNLFLKYIRTLEKNRSESLAYLMLLCMAPVTAVLIGSVMEQSWSSHGKRLP